MKLISLSISNFKSVSSLEMTDLQNLVLIAGQNGVGKSTIFDSLRLLKSTYGGYGQNEINTWFNEFQVKFNQGRLDSPSRLMSDDSKRLAINAKFRLSEEEQGFIRNHSKRIIQESLWRRSNSNSTFPDEEFEQNIISSSQLSKLKVHSEEIYNQMLPLLDKSLIAAVQISPTGNITYEPNEVLEFIFSHFFPENIGVLDYHGAHRDYKKENLNNLNFRWDGSERLNYRNHILYNYSNKYQNVKNELATSYIKELIARESGETSESINDLNESLKELFENFFPEKKFLGVQPTRDGKLEFPVELESGSTHDIGDLSSGEKEVLFGYLRLRNQAYRNSIVLIDEPELHLNPALARKLPEFYQKHIGDVFNNQLILVTHSDFILKEASKLENASVYHMSKPQVGGKNQLKLISSKDGLESALIDLVGSLSEYKPGKMVLVLESENSEFDKQMIKRLFPELADELNFISSGSKTNVKSVFSVLSKAYEDGVLENKFSYIVDPDSEVQEDITSDSAKAYRWDVYHIENYLLSFSHIRKATNSISEKTAELNDQDIEERLKQCARNRLESMVNHEFNEYVKSQLMTCFNTRINTANDLVDESILALCRTKSNLEHIEKGSFSERKLKIQLARIKSKFNNSLKNNDWMKIVKGREILNEYVQLYTTGVNYESFRNLIISYMADENFQPKDMKAILEEVINRNRKEAE